MYAGLRDPARFDRARHLNEAAIAQFTSDADQARQHQYRAQLETYAGDFANACEYLAKSLGCAPTHQAIGEAIGSLPHVPQGFALLHWWRLGAAVMADGIAEERDAFLAAQRASKLHTSAWCEDEGLPYPAHGIRRYQAVIAAREGEPRLAESVLGKLRRLGSSAATHPLMAILEAVAHVEVAALVWRSDERAARRLLTFQDANRRGAKELLDAVERRVSELPGLHRWVQDAKTAVGRALSGDLSPDDVTSILLRPCRLVGY